MFKCKKGVYTENPTHPNLMGVIEFKRGNTSKAIENLEKARENYVKIMGRTTGRLVSNDVYAKSFYMLG